MRHKMAVILRPQSRPNDRSAPSKSLRTPAHSCRGGDFCLLAGRFRADSCPESGWNRAAAAQRQPRRLTTTSCARASRNWPPRAPNMKRSAETEIEAACRDRSARQRPPQAEHRADRHRRPGPRGRSRGLPATEARMQPLEQQEKDLRHSLDERREVIAEILAALQRIGRRPPPALLVSPEDARKAVRSAIVLGAVVPEMRARADRLATDLVGACRNCAPISQPSAPSFPPISRRCPTSSSA